ncbi:RDD family protein [Streptomyces tritici]|uniref:RDD family protein n=1 Tax=Streptomyces tritici TaxID=2054410 RepID=UPI003AF13B8B
MATPPGSGGEVPQAGYYPDPSIPGYVRYWNGAAWVPGTSRPAPKEGEAMPAPPASAMPPAPSLASPAPAPRPVPSVEETGPVFLDEEPVEESRPEPASAWQADASRQSGFGGERDQKVSWGSSETADPRAARPDPRTPSDRVPDGRTPDERTPDGRAPEGEPSAAPARRIAGTVPGSGVVPADPTGGALPGVRQTQPGPDAPEGTVAIRRRPAGGDSGTMTIRALGGPAAAQAPQPQAGTPQAAAPQAPAAAQPAAHAPHTAAPQVPAQAQPPAAQAPAATPVTTGPGGGASSWAQQVARLSQPEPAAPPQPLPQQAPQQQQQPVVPWKPPVEDPFLKAAQAQASARPGALGKRFAARLIDSVLLGALAGAAASPFVLQALDHIAGKIEAAKQSGTTVQVWLVDGTTSVQFGIALGIFLVLGVLYEVLPTVKWGRTLGKKLCGLQVRDIEAHEPPGFGAALRRWLVYGVLGLLVVGVVNVMWCLFDRPWRQCWHDKAARTFVAAV